MENRDVKGISNTRTDPNSRAEESESVSVSAFVDSLLLTFGLTVDEFLVLFKHS